MTVRVCFVCLGNICRSPTAEGIMLSLIEKRGLEDLIEVDSAGTGAYHVGEPADSRSRATAEARGVPLPSRARQFEAEDFARFDYVIAMDTDNAKNLRRLTAHEGDRAKISMLRDWDSSAVQGASVPDPYYGGPRGFDDVFDICEAGCRGLLDHLVATHGPQDAT